MHEAVHPGDRKTGQMLSIGPIDGREVVIGVTVSSHGLDFRIYRLSEIRPASGHGVANSRKLNCMKRDRNVFRREIHGFTLIELMVTLVVVGVIVVIGVPGVKALLENNQVTTHTNQLVSSMHLARSEAVKRNAPVTICASSDGKNCEGEWVDGWIVKDEGDGLLQVITAPKKPVRMKAETKKIQFNSDGTADYSGPIEIVKAGFKRKLVVSKGGSVSTCNPVTDKDCKVDDE